jgi:hypothetical protein
MQDTSSLSVLKTETRTVSTLHIGKFKARETIRICQECGKIYRPKELSRLVPPSCNFGYDILVYVGKALFVDHLADRRIIEHLAPKNISISPSAIAYLGKKFIVYLTLAHRNSSARIKRAMAAKGGYILHVDATYEDKSPLLMSGLDSIMHIVLGNCKLPSENSDDIIPFLHDIRDLFGEPLALVHDMSPAIMKAVSTVFPNTLDFICHFHFLRDIGKDLLGPEYANIRRKMREYGMTSKLQRRLRSLKHIFDKNIQLIDMLESEQQESACCEESLKSMPAVAAFSLIHWALDGKQQGNGYGFPFDRPYLILTQRLKRIYTELEQLRKIQLRQDDRDNIPLHKTFFDLTNFMTDKSLWKSVEIIESEIQVFDTLRKALRIAPKTSKKGLNNDGIPAEIGTIKEGVETFKKTIIHSEGYSENIRHRKMIEQIDKYWQKLFADPIEVDTPKGKTYIQPQRTNNFAEQHFRDVKRGYRKKTGNGSLGKTLRTMLANTPLVKNLQNAEYMNILLHGKSNLEEVFAEIDSTEVRNEMKKSQDHVEKIPARLKKLTNKTTYPEVLRNYVTKLKSNGILC